MVNNQRKNMDFPPNSHKSKEEQNPEKKKELTKIVSGEVVTKKKPLKQRIKAIFVGGEFKNAAAYIAIDVLIPAARNMVVDATTKGIERLIYGESLQRSRQNDYNRSRVSYNSPIDRNRQRGVMLPDQPPYHGRSSRNSNEIIVNSRKDAELVLSTIADIIETYDVASVADLNELVGLPSTHIDNKWGWTSIRHADLRQVREGWLIDLPPAKPI
jgi:hypothetical protein